MSVTVGAIDKTRTRKVSNGEGGTFDVPVSVIVGSPDNGFYLNMANGNAALLFGLIEECLGTNFDAFEGEMEIALALRSVVAVNARFDSVAPKHVRHEETLYGKPRTNEDGTIELKPVRMLSHGADTDYLRRRFDDYAKLVNEAARLGATHIMWG